MNSKVLLGLVAALALASAVSAEPQMPAFSRVRASISDAAAVSTDRADASLPEAIVLPAADRPVATLEALSADASRVGSRIAAKIAQGFETMRLNAAAAIPQQAEDEPAQAVAAVHVVGPLGRAGLGHRFFGAPGARHVERASLDGALPAVSGRREHAMERMHAFHKLAREDPERFRELVRRHPGFFYDMVKADGAEGPLDLQNVRVTIQKAGEEGAQEPDHELAPHHHRDHHRGEDEAERHHRDHHRGEDEAERHHHGHHRGEGEAEHHHHDHHRGEGEAERHHRDHHRGEDEAERHHHGHHRGEGEAEHHHHDHHRGEGEAEHHHHDHHRGEGEAEHHRHWHHHHGDHVLHRHFHGKHHRHAFPCGHGPFRASLAGARDMMRPVAFSPLAIVLSVGLLVVLLGLHARCVEKRAAAAARRAALEARDAPLLVAEDSEDASLKA